MLECYICNKFTKDYEFIKINDECPKTVCLECNKVDNTIYKIDILQNEKDNLLIKHFTYVIHEKRQLINANDKLIYKLNNENNEHKKLITTLTEQIELIEQKQLTNKLL